MPQLGESIVEATLVRWLVTLGETVTRGQMLAEIETDKATSEIPAPCDGTIAEFLATEGTTLAVGAPLLRLDAAPGAPSAGVESMRTTDESVAANASGSAGAEGTSRTEGGRVPVQSPPAPTARAPASTRLPSRHLAPQNDESRGGPTRFSPAVRRLARRFDVDLGAIAGTGKGGRVTRDDVLRTLSSRPTPSTPPPVPAGEATPFASNLPRQGEIASVIPSLVPETSPSGDARPSGPSPAYRPPVYRLQAGDRVIPFSRRRAQIAGHMVHSLRAAAHVFALAEIDMSRVTAAKSADAPAAERSGLKLTFMPYVVSAVARALGEYPELNATVTGETLVLRAERNIGVAVDTEEGLVVPVIRRADELGILGIARVLGELSERARSAKLTPDDVSGGSFTISNPGREGNLFGVSIIRQPEVAILRLGAIVKRPVVREVEGEDIIVPRPMMYAALSYDHRVIDGRIANAFLRRVTVLLASAEAARAR